MQFRVSMDGVKHSMRPLRRRMMWAQQRGPRQHARRRLGRSVTTLLAAETALADVLLDNLNDILASTCMIEFWSV